MAEALLLAHQAKMREKSEQWERSKGGVSHAGKGALK